MQVFCLSLLTVILVFAQSTSQKTVPPAVADQGLYYTYNGTAFTEVRSDSEHAQADRWVAFYFRKGASPSATSQRWGLEIQSTPAEVMKSVEASQKFERAYEKWCSCEWGSDTFFNVIAPVALKNSASDLSAGKAGLLLKAKGVGNRLGKILETLNDASEPSVASAESIHEALDQYGKINNLISLLSDNAVANIEKRLNQLVDEVSNIEKVVLAVNQPASTPVSPANFSGAVIYPIARTINGVKSLANVVQAMSDRGSEISVENHLENGQWERYRVAIAEVTSSAAAAIDESGTVWSVQLECKNRAQCVRWDGGESLGLNGSDKDGNANEIRVAFKTELEAISFADRVSPRRLSSPAPVSPLAPVTAPPAKETKTAVAHQPAKLTKTKDSEERKLYTIQVGVFSSESKAEAVVSQLKNRKYDAVFVDTIPADGATYHVRVGRFPDLQAAKRLRTRLQKDGFATFLTTVSP